MKKLLLLIFFPFIAVAGYAQNNDSVSLTNRITQSDLVVYGKVADLAPFWDNAHRNIYTSYKITVLEILKGAETEDIEVIEKGGILDSIWQSVSTSSHLKKGKTGFFILKHFVSENGELNLSPGKFMLLDDYQGFIEYEVAAPVIFEPLPVTDKEIGDFILKCLQLKRKGIIPVKDLELKSAAATHSITSISPTTSTAGTLSPLTIRGNGFGEKQQSGEVWFVNADSPTSSFTDSGFDITSWSDTLIQLMIPSRASTGKVRVKIDGEYAESAQTLTIRYACLDNDNEPIMLINADGSGGYTWQLNTNVASNAQAESLVIKSINQWSCKTQIPWRVGEPTGAMSGADDICSISFGNVGSSLAVTSTFFQAKGNSGWVLKEADITLSNSRNWCYDRDNILPGQYDFETVVLHELGHAHLIGHVNSSNDLMHYGISAKSYRNINSNNLECGQYILNESLNYSNRFFKTIVLPDLSSVGSAGNISGSPEVCAGQNQVIYTVPEIENATAYIWTLPQGTAGSSSTNTIRVNFGTNAISGDITVSGANACNAGAPATKAVTVNPFPEKPLSINGDSDVSAGQSGVVYSVSEVENADSYIWVLPPGATGSSTTNSIEVSFGANAKSGNISVKAINGCGNSDAVSKAITVLSLPEKPGAIAGLSAVCAGDGSVTYSVAVIQNADSYIWTLPQGATGSSTTNSIQVSFDANARSGNIFVKGLNSLGSGTSTSKYIAINSLPGKPNVINGESEVCAGQSYVVYSVPKIENAESYIWTLPQGVTGSSTANTILVDFDTNAKSGDISVKASNSCGNSAAVSKAITVNNPPEQPDAIVGESEVCAGESSVIYSVSHIESADTYIWLLPPGATGSSTTNSIEVSFGAEAKSGNISVQASNSCGNSAAVSKMITVNNPPEQPDAIVGGSEVCAGESSVIYSVSHIENADTYIWLLPPGATGSSTTNSIEVSFGAEAKSGNISVKASNSCGNSAAVSKAITVNNLPEQPDAINGESEVCAGESSVIYSVSEVENTDFYIWTLPEGTIGSSTTNSIQVSFGVEAQSGKITVTPVNSCGSGGFAALPVTVNIIPATPAISLIDNTLHSDAPFGNQ